MYELSIACRYLVPRIRELSVSMITLISILVISLVVWLTIVFFSATAGLEKRWTERLVAITAPVRLLPTPDYYASYYYQIDSQSASSNFRSKSLAEKLHSPITNPYNSSQDPTLAYHFPKIELGKNGNPLDIVKETCAEIASIPGVTVSPFETGFATAKIGISSKNAQDELFYQVISLPSYVVSYDIHNPRVTDAILPLAKEDQTFFEEKLNRYDIKKITKELPYIQNLGNAVYLPKTLHDSGVQVGNTGSLIYQSQSATSIQEQIIPIFVIGFYDPGIIPIGGKLILANPAIVSEIRSGFQSDDQLLPTGLNVHVDKLRDARKIKEEIIQKLSSKNLLKYFTVQSYDEYDFTKDIFTQLKSERNLFSLISVIVIVVACSNIISMLIILVHEKSQEIAILRSLGASRLSIALIFAISGFFMGTLGSLIGGIAAIFTIKNLQTLLDILGKAQGFDVLNKSLYGDVIPTEVNASSFVFVVVVTAIISTIAALVPAIKASRQNTAEALRG